MIRLFGGAAIEVQELPRNQRAAHRHALALLAVLTLAPGRTMSRDKLVALLWPEGTPDTVRHRLNVLVYELRKTLGREAITSINDDLQLSSERVSVDVDRFLRLLEQGCPAQAVEFYRGPFLDGFHLPESPEFEEWAQHERSRLAAEMAEALEGLADAATRDRAGMQAVAWWRRLVELDPLATRPTLGLIQSLAAEGESADALRAAQEHARRRASELGAPPDPTVNALADNLRQLPPAGPLRVRALAGPSAEVLARLRPPSSPTRAPTTARRGRQIWLLGAVALVLALLAGRELLMNVATSGTVAPATSRVVILPFVVRGGDSLAYLSEGMAELLSLTMDGVGGIRTADPHAVLGVLSLETGHASDPDWGRRVADRFGAGYFVLGTVIESGGRLEIRASMYGPGNDILSRAAASRPGEMELGVAVDGLTRQLIVPRYASREDRLTRLAVTTSASVPALRAHLLGESQLRAGNYEAAAQAFREALQVDSTFALAWYRLAVAAEWALQPHEAAAAVAQAVRHSARLPERDRLLLSGWQAYASGQAERAEALYRRILDHYPDEVEAWLQLGEIEFHYSASKGGTIARARPAFERVLKLDPVHEGARVHLARIAAHEGDRAALDRHADALISRAPSSSVALEMQVLRAFATGDSEAVRQLQPAMQETDSYALLGTLLSLFYARRWDGVEWIGALLRDPTRPVEVRTAGHLVETLLEMAHGRRQMAWTAALGAEKLDPLRGLELQVLLQGLPFGPADQDRAVELLGRWARLGSAAHQSSGGDSFFLPDPNRVRPLMRSYLGGILRAALGDSVGALREVAYLATATNAGTDSALGRDLAGGVHAEVLLRTGKTAEALAELEQIDAHTTYQLVLPSPFDPRLRERFMRAEILAARGRIDEALAVYGTIGTHSLFDLPYLAPALFRMAELQREMGRLEEADRLLQQGMSLWERADPELAAYFLAPSKVATWNGGHGTRSPGGR
jgi:DNA-binding SARP family transcriptional activator/Tfp pilus assembly protein PilF/TolB-like protein